MDFRKKLAKKLIKFSKKCGERVRESNPPKPRSIALSSDLKSADATKSSYSPKGEIIANLA